jgi:flagellar basal body-associated protein FliL
MEDAYQKDAYQDEYYDEPEPKKGMSGWLIALIVVLVLVVVCCICACAAFLLAGPAIGNVFSTVIEAMTPMP